MKLFVCSDLHSFFTPFKKALDVKGFEENNPEHLLIVCGDIWDRGDESIEMYNFLNNLTNVVLIRGNHEDLLVEMLNRGYGERHDISNGTVNTVVSLVDYTGKKTNNTKECCAAVKELVTPFIDKMVNYFETKNYIFVHGWIPCEKWTGRGKPWYQQKKTYEYNPDWRNCNDVEWEYARWTNGMRAWYNKVVEPDKTIVCGHWHCSYGHALMSMSTDNWLTEFGEDAIWEPFEADGIIALDRCTAHTGEVNIVVLEDELLEKN